MIAPTLRCPSGSEARDAHMRDRTWRRRVGAAGIVALAVVALASVQTHAQQGAPANGEWPTYGGDLGGTKYSPLDQIDRDNFGPPRDRLAVAVGRCVPEHRYAGRRRVVGRLASHLRGAVAPRPEPLARRATTDRHQPEGDAADGRRAPLHQHADLAGRVDRRRDRQDALGLQPEDVRGRDHHDDRALEPARGGVLVGRPGA